MHDCTILAGATSKIIEVMLRDSTTGAGKTGLAHGDVSAYYTREGGTETEITLASGSAGDSYSSGKWAEVGGTNSKGLYQLHVPNAALAAGVQAVTINLQASGTLDKTIRIVLISADLRDAVRLGLTALPNAAADAAGGLPISDAGGLDMDALSTFDPLTDGVDVDFVEGTDATDYFSGLVTTITTAITNGTNSVLAKLLAYVRLIVRSDAAAATDQSTELTAINADAGSGAGDFDNTAQAIEEHSTHTPADVRTEMDANSTGLADVYYADIELTIDEANSRDEYTVTFFRNGARLTSGITSPTLQVVKRADGTDLIAATALTQIGSTGSYKLDEASNRLTGGEAALAIASATIDSGSRSYSRLVTRDSTA